MHTQGPFPVFISHSHHDVATAIEVKQQLSLIMCTGFLAHDDIHVSAEWHETILLALSTRWFFVSLWSQAYLASSWCMQEAGIAAANYNIVEIPLSIDGTMPQAFSSKKQARKVVHRQPELLDLMPGLMGDESSSLDYKPEYGLIDYVTSTNSFRSAESRMALLEHFYYRLSANYIYQLADGIIRNDQIHLADECVRKHIPLFIQTCGSHLGASQHGKLQDLLRRGK